MGKDVDIAYNMATQIAYEEITGKAFDTESLNKASNMMALYYACILANNELTTPKVRSLTLTRNCQSTKKHLMVQ